MLATTVFQWAQATGLIAFISTGASAGVGVFWWHEKRLRAIEKIVGELKKENEDLRKRQEESDNYQKVTLKEIREKLDDIPTVRAQLDLLIQMRTLATEQ